jgi:hypothetical protein
VGSVVAAAVTCAPDPADVGEALAVVLAEVVEGLLDVVPAEGAGALLAVVLAVVLAEVAEGLLDAGALLDGGVGVGAECAGTVSREKKASAAIVPTASARLRLAVIQGVLSYGHPGDPAKRSCPAQPRMPRRVSMSQNHAGIPTWTQESLRLRVSPGLAPGSPTGFR